MIKKSKKTFVFFVIIIAIISVLILISFSLIKRMQLNQKLNKYDESYEKILAVCSKDFLGNHPIDENFMLWFMGKYSSEELDAIVKNMDFDDPDVWYAVSGRSIHVLWYEYCLDTGLEAYDLSHIHQVSCASGSETTFLFTGDLSMAENTATTNYMNKQKNGLSDCFSEKLLNTMVSADIFMVNNEFSYTSRGTAIEGKAYNFRSNPSYANQLYSIGTDIVSLANNHVYDFGAVGFQDTLDTLNSIGMTYVGAGENLEQAKQAEYYIVNGKKVAILSATQIERSYTYTKAADATSGGVMKCLVPDDFIDAIKTADKNADYVIVMAHWGTEHEDQYGADQNSLANKFIAAGADCIIGGHTHCLQGVDYIDGAPVFYSLGNYWFATGAEMPEDYYGGLAKVTIGSDGQLQAQLIPTKFSNGVTSLVSDNDTLSTIYSELSDLSGNGKLDSNGNIIKKGIFD